MGFEGNITAPLSWLNTGKNLKKTVTSQIYIRTSTDLGTWSRNLTDFAPFSKCFFAICTPIGEISYHLLVHLPSGSQTKKTLGRVYNPSLLTF